VELIAAQKQGVWKLPAVVNFSMGGAGTGFYLLALFVTLPANGNWLNALVDANGDWVSAALVAAVFKLLGVACAGLGFLALTLEAGQPQRGINLFRHLRRSWMSRETLAFFLFGTFAGLDWVVPHPILRALAALAAFCLMLAQGFIVYRARGVTTWNTPRVVFYFLTCGSMTGAGLMLVVFNGVKFLMPVTSTVSFAWVGLAAGVLNLAMWFVYLQTADAAFQKAAQGLRNARALWQIVGAGHVLPALLLLPAASGFVPVSGLLEIVAGALLVFGGARQKYGIILEAGYLRAIVLSPAKSGRERGAGVPVHRPARRA
jgi:phenylacetyl-CoA:acceptor oxidoreductase subunit 2